MNHGLKEQIAAYWSARAASYDGSPGHGIAPGAETAAWQALLRARLGGLHGLRVLELASGTGEFTRLLAQAGADVTGIDLAEGMMARAQAKLAMAGAAARLYPGDAEDTREPAGRYDAAVCRNLVWTLPDPGRAAAEWFRVLRPGGRLLIIDGDWVCQPWWGRLRRTVGQWLCSTLLREPDPVDWTAHAAIMAQVYFRDGLRPGPLSLLLRAAGFQEIATGGLAAVHQAQRRAAGFPRSLTVGAWHDFWMVATKPETPHPR